MTYTQLKTQQCPPLDVLLSGSKYMSDLGYGMRQWLTKGCQKAMPTPEERAPDHPLAGVCNAGIDLCTSEGEHACCPAVPHTPYGPRCPAIACPSFWAHAPW